MGEDKQVNLDSAADYVQRAAQLGAKIVVLPEMFNCPYSNDSFPTYAEPIPDSGQSHPNIAGERERKRAEITFHDVVDDATVAEVDPSLHPTTAALLKLSKEHGVWLVGGSIPESGAQGEIFNTCLVSNPEGEIVGRHRKLHLFDIDIPGGIRFQESETLTAGDSLTLVETPWGKMGVGICYDMRFPEMAQACAADGAVLMIYPGAFNTTTGPLHWEILQKAR